jgi:hypothetical protein
MAAIRRRRPSAPLVFLALVLAAPLARAKDKGGTELPIATPPELPPDLWVDQMMRRNWELGPARPFAAATIDLGYLYLRPRLSLGYGRPFTQWVGVDLNPLIAGSYIGFYGGVRAEIPHLNWRGGVRTMASYTRTFLDRMDGYGRVEFDAGNNDKAVVTTIETEIEGSLPAGPGNFIGLASLSYVTGVQDGKNVFEESLRVIVEPPWVVRARGGYLLRWGALSQHSIGVVGEVFDIPARPDGIIVRLGLVVRVVLSRRVEVRGSFVPTIIGPDTIGLAGSDFTELGLRYRWASE